MTRQLEETEASTNAASPKRVIYIEDRSDNYRLIHRLIDSLPGVTLDRAESAAEGVEMVRNTKYDLILSDVLMDDSDLDTFAEVIIWPLRQLVGNTKIIAITAHALKGDRERLLAAGCDECVHKPIDFVKTRTLIQQELGLI